MYRVAKKMVGNSDEVSDIIQEIFIDLFDKLNDGNVIYQPNRWLYRATINKCIDNKRKHKEFQSIESISNLKSELDLIENNELKNAVNLAISKLRPQEKMSAVSYSEGLTYKEIAEATGIKLSSIGKKLSRTLKKIEKELRIQRYEMY